MRGLKNKQKPKILILALVLLMVFDFIVPTHVTYADSDEVTGGELFQPIAKLFCGFGDLFVKGLQEYFVGDNDIKEGSEFYVEYGPALIFSGKIPGLDANFVKPGEGKSLEAGREKVKTYGKSANIDDLISKNGTNALIFSGVGTAEGGEEQTGSEIYEKYNTNKETLKNSGKTKVEGKEIEVKKEDGPYGTSQYRLYIDGKAFGGAYGLPEQAVAGEFKNAVDKILGDSLKNQDSGNTEIEKYLSQLKSSRELKLDNGYVLKIETVDIAGTSNYELNVYNSTEKEIGSAAGELQETISSWYKTLRQVAIVGLLSVLVYIGIRMLMTSIAQDKAKYQKMFMDWAVAMCILFVLHYIMVFTMMAVEEVSNIFIGTDTIIADSGDGDGQIDVLMSSVRTSVGEYSNASFTEIFAEMVIYLVLVIFTVMFTWTYLKRLLYLAFFTMIAPLIALTYPLDKIKDGQAQAFSKWIKEYIYNALIPVVHLLLYTMFVGSSMDFAKTNPIYALAAIAFLIPAEKFFKSMFGFDKATAMGQLGAAASGAIVMNAVNKMKSSGGKSGGGSSSGAKDDNGAGYIPGPRQANNPGGNQNSGGSQTPGGSNTPATNPNNLLADRAVDVPNGTKPDENNGIWNAVGATVRQKVNPRKIGRSVRKGARKTIVGAVGGAALGTIGLAAGLATGDASNVFKYAGGAAAVGAAGANSLAQKGLDLEKSTRESYLENLRGTDEFNTRKNIKELAENNEFRKLTKGKDQAQIVRDFHANGITSQKDIINMLALGESMGFSQDEVMAAYKLKKRYGSKSKDIKEGLKDKNITDAATLERAMSIIENL